MAKRLNLIFGATPLGNAGWNGIAAEDGSDEAAQKVFELLKKHQVNHLDTARLYGPNEEALGRFKAGNDHGFLIDTKWLGGFFDPTSVTKDRIISDAKDSLAKLGVSKVHTFYLQSPDVETEIEATLDGVNEVHREGSFEHFGLSNFSPVQVQQVYDVCNANGFVLPTVYQGLYSPVNRKVETELLPLLRKLGIVLNAYSPLAGGFLTKTRSQVTGGDGRFAKDQFFGLYDEMYNNEPHLEALQEWGYIASEEGISKAALAYRWMCYHSALKAELGDGVLLGGRPGRLSQLEETFEALDQGPLSTKAAKRIEELWVKLVPYSKYTDNFQVISRLRA